MSNVTGFSMNSPKNTIAILGTGFVRKTFISQESCYREYLGARIFANCVQSNVPKVYRKNGNECLIEQVLKAKTAYELICANKLTMQQVSAFVAEFVGNTATLVDANKITKSLAYEKQFTSTIKQFYFYKDVLLDLLGVQNTALLENSLEQISIWILKSDNKVSVLHRDLHLSNILVDSSGRMYVIDFEQTTLGPLELEFQNSLFYKDHKSLDVEAIVNVLQEKFQISYSEKIARLLRYSYVVEQLVQALELGNVQKAKFIASKV